jgi:hypothetical protein
VATPPKDFSPLAPMERAIDWIQRGDNLGEIWKKIFPGPVDWTPNKELSLMDHNDFCIVDGQYMCSHLTKISAL